ncbi:unnamed protein product [Hymenolepis diminuta]|uniref:Uncharacterized protein n=1 Tax=Hymenolepis diminuta TaxID=6216 RepID=A0A564YQZ8_HYMDI|nr:unnamed protein product [Hymenolepis diminuta]
MSHRRGKGKHTSDDSSRHRLINPDINQSCLHRPFIFLQSSRPIKAPIQPYPYACPHPVSIINSLHYTHTGGRVDPSSPGASLAVQPSSSLFFLETLY